MGKLKAILGQSGANITLGDYYTQMFKLIGVGPVIMFKLWKYKVISFHV